MKRKIRKPHFWIPEQDQFLIDNIKGTPRKKLQEMFNNYFKLDLSYSQIKSRCDKLKLRNGIDSTFKKGVVPYTKGKSWNDYMSPEAQANSRKTTFKKGDIPLNTKPIGAERIESRDGYVLVKTAEPNIWRLKHYVEWEKVHGKVPKGKRFIFLDGNPSNCNLDNLKLVDFGIGAVMNKIGLYVDGDAELQEVAINTTKLIIGINNAKRKDRKKDDE